MSKKPPFWNFEHASAALSPSQQLALQVRVLDANFCITGVQRGLKRNNIVTIMWDSYSAWMVICLERENGAKNELRGRSSSRVDGESQES
jgi:hypothetical protein